MLPWRAQAQTSDTAVVDATATLAAPPPVLSIQSISSLQFGPVAAPGNTGANICEYRVRFDGERAVISLFNDTIAASFVCQFHGTSSRAVVEIGCEAGNTVRYDFFGEDSPLAAEGVFFRVDPEDFGFLNVATGSPEQQAVCSQDNTVSFVSGGRLVIDASASFGQTELVVGRLRFDFLYEASCICG